MIKNQDKIDELYHILDDITVKGNVLWQEIDNKCDHEFRLHKFLGDVEWWCTKCSVNSDGFKNGTYISYSEFISKDKTDILELELEINEWTNLFYYINRYKFWIESGYYGE